MSKTPSTDRSHGGPGSSRQGAKPPHRPASSTGSGGRSNSPPPANAPTNPDRSEVSGGGGERDRHHTHEPDTKR